MSNVILLSILQGIAEFLPISSSGHLVIAEHLLGIKEGGMALDLFLHFGTLASIVVYYHKTIANILMKFDVKFMAKIILSCLPAIVVYLLLKDTIDHTFENPRVVGAFLMFTGAVLIGTRYIPTGAKEVSCFRAFLMGLGQAFAILPGVSRSGMTLAVARAGKVDSSRSAEFSFLMSAPLIVGGCVLELLDCGGSPDLGGFSWGLVMFGMFLAFVFGLAALYVLERILKSKWFWLFGPYCILAGLLTVFMI